MQAEFAKSAVDYLHRVGRTARAGQFGVVTSLYTAENRALVEAVKQAEEAGLSVVCFFLHSYFLVIIWVNLKLLMICCHDLSQMSLNSNKSI